MRLDRAIIVRFNQARNTWIPEKNGQAITDERKRMLEFSSAQAAEVFLRRAHPLDRVVIVTGENR
jgi:hypothetical protein